MIADVKLLELLVKQGVLQQEKAEQAKKEAFRMAQPLETVLVKSGFITDEELTDTKAAFLGVPYVDLSCYRLDRELVKLIPEKIVQKYSVIPLFSTGNALSLGMIDPQNILAIDRVRKLTSFEVIDPIMVSHSGFQIALNTYYRPRGSMADFGKPLEKEKKLNLSEALLADIPEQTPANIFVESLMLQAVLAHASDIHIEPQEAVVSVRLRMEGQLKRVKTFPLSMQHAVVSRIKTLAGLDVTENSKPQDGKMRIALEGKDLDVRVSTFPTLFGENVVLSLLDKRATPPELTGLGFSAEYLKQFSKLMGHSHGIILVTGPTGSGKTTTLCSALSKIKSEDKNVVTIEDPVEYVLPGVRQTQVDPKAGITFSSGMRGSLLQDPDIMMVGEILDQETLDVAIRAALTGRLVFSSLHTDDAPSALTRLIDMGAEPFLIASSVIGILAQRLVRVNCVNCREVFTPHSSVLKNVGFPDDSQLVRGKGCPHCNQTGFSGRIGIFELLLITDPIKALVGTRSSVADIRKKAAEQGMRTLWQEGLERVLQGVTTLEEVLRVTEIE